jgi:hypothetical protein
MRALLDIFLCCQFLVIAAQGATLAGQPVQGGKTVEIRFPVARAFQDVAAQSGNPRPETGRAVLTFPPGFDPARNWPILVVTSTSDFNRTSPMDAEWYRRPALAEGWVLLASDATIKPRVDSTQWRLAILAAALESIRKEWPQSAKWPVAFAGFSGGAKRSAVLGAMLAKTGTDRPKSRYGHFFSEAELFVFSASSTSLRTPSGVRSFAPISRLSTNSDGAVLTPTALARA